MLQIYTDGAYRGTKVGAWAYYLYDERHCFVKTKIVYQQTNNWCELQAALQAVKKALGLGIHQGVLYTDSQYVIYGLNRGCISKTHQNLWGEFKSVLRHFDLKYVKVLGHSTSFGNRQSDLTMRYILDEKVKKKLF